MAKVVSDVEEVFPVLDRILAKIVQIDTSLKNINTYALTDMVSLIDKIEAADDKTRDVLLKVLSV